MSKPENKGSSKPWFTLLKEDRQGFLMIAVLLLLGLVIYLSIELWRFKQEGHSSLYAPLYVADSLQRVVGDSDNVWRPAAEDEEVKLTIFDPNRADSATLRSLGLSRYATNNVLKYRAKGGFYYEAEDFKRLYGLDRSLYERLRPYIQIAQRAGKKEDEPREAVRKDDGKFEEVTSIDLNRADTALLRKIPGVGRYYSSEIIRYRRELGGYVDVHQIKEIKSIPDSVTDYLPLWFYIGEENEIERLNINRSSIERLRAHPYLDFYKAKAIVEYRRKRGAIPSYNALKLLKEFDHVDWNKFERYFKLEE